MDFVGLPRELFEKLFQETRDRKTNKTSHIQRNSQIKYKLKKGLLFTVWKLSKTRWHFLLSPLNQLRVKYLDRWGNKQLKAFRERSCAAITFYPKLSSAEKHTVAAATDSLLNTQGLKGHEKTLCSWFGLRLGIPGGNSLDMDWTFNKRQNRGKPQEDVWVNVHKQGGPQCRRTFFLFGIVHKLRKHAL